VSDARRDDGRLRGGSCPDACACHMGKKHLQWIPITFSSPVGLLAVQRKLSSATGLSSCQLSFGPAE